MVYIFHISATVTTAELIWRILIMVTLLGCSAFFSGSETAYFQLSRRQIKLFARSSYRFEKLVAWLLSKPSRFLTSLLFGNMLVNVLYFSIGSIVSLQLTELFGRSTGVTGAVLIFVALLLFGEMLPKSIACSNSIRFSVLFSPVCYLMVRLTGPLLWIIEHLIVIPSIRLLSPQRNIGHESIPVSATQLQSLLETSRQRGDIGQDENLILSEIIKFGFLKTRHVMKPRVDITTCCLYDRPEKVLAMMREKRLKRIAVYSTDPDKIVGTLHIRNMLIHKGKAISQLLGRVHYIPEQATVEKAMEYFKREKADFAVVIDEYGGSAGTIELDDVIDQLLGGESSAGQEPVESIGPLAYRLNAALPIHDWAEAFGMDLEQQRLTTIGGFVTALLGNIPKPGDTATYKNMTFTVESVKKNRIVSLILTLDSILDKGADG